MKIKVLGVCGSPIYGGNVELLLRESMQAAQEIDGVETEILLLSQKNIKDCRHCNWCTNKQEEDHFCNLEDDMCEIYPSVLEADGLIVASPAYFGRISGLLANFLDRLRPCVFGKIYKDGLNDNVGGAFSVAMIRPRVLLSINYAFWTLGMLNVPQHGLMFGAAGVSSIAGTGDFVPADRHQVLKDEFGLRNARRLAHRMIEIIKIVKLGKQALS